VATFLPGRLEFEHEIDNDAEDLIKDLEFGLVYAFDGDKMPEDDQDLDIIAKRQRLERAHTPVNGDSFSQMDVDPTPAPNVANVPQDDSAAVNGDDKDKDEADAPHVPLPIETDESIAFKLTLLEMYLQRVEKRHEAKHFIFERGLLEYKKVGEL
jgi:transcriptional adapter 2-alpha